MNNNNYPLPPSHRTFQFGKVTIDSNFDSGNCSYAERVNPTTVLKLLFSMQFGLLPIIPRIVTASGFIFRLLECQKVL